MKVFISWSGDYSKDLAASLRDWIPLVIQSVRAYFTPSDLDKGSRWSTEIAGELEKSDYGIFCVTPQSVGSEWMMFEAGAISKNVGTARVTPLLFDLDVSNLGGPLVQFQCAKFGKTEIKALLSGINAQCGETKLDDSRFGQVFDTFWPKLEAEITQIRATYEVEAGHSLERTDRELLEEILSLTRNFSRVSPERAHFPFSPAAVTDLVSTLIKTVNLVSVRTPHDIIMKELSRFSKQIHHIARRSDGLRQEDIMQALKDLDFRMDPSDDDLPF